MNVAPRALRNSIAEAVLRVEWPDGHVQQLSHGQLRAACPCSQCRAGRLQQRIDLVAAGVRLTDIQAQGYGVQLRFDDGHERGIYPWSYLRELAGIQAQTRAG